MPGVFTTYGRFALAAVLVVTAPVAGAAAHDFALLHSFTGGSDGAYPQAALMRDGDGNFFGTTTNGGTNNDGTVFRIGTDGKEKVVYSFGSNANDGVTPFSSLVEDKAGNLYGTTDIGGAGNAGTVFKLAPDGTERVLYSFTGGNDGAGPYAGLTPKASYLYGTTTSGGASGKGVVFKLAPDGTETVLHSFTGGDDGGVPLAGLILDRGGDFYGTTYEGGADNQGTVYKVSRDGVETALYSFTGGSDGGSPGGALTMDGKGNLYGTTVLGGANDAGTVFSLAPDGTETVLHSFTGGNDGADPFCGLIFDAKGDLYGTTSVGGVADGGTVFRLSPDGTLTALNSFTGAGGASPQAGVIAKKGELYGTTPLSGTYGYGTVYKLKE